MVVTAKLPALKSWLVVNGGILDGAIYHQLQPGVQNPEIASLMTYHHYLQIIKQIC
jgi:hypothetical protein